MPGFSLGLAAMRTIGRRFLDRYPGLKFPGKKPIVASRVFPTTKIYGHAVPMGGREVIPGEYRMTKANPDKNMADGYVLGHLAAAESEWLRLGDVWAGQVALARRQMDGAILELTREFGDIVSSLGALSRLARELEGNEVRLSRVIQETGEDTRSGESWAVVLDLENSAVRLEQEALRIRGNVEASLVHLQFQDRVDQILAHVASSIAALPEALAGVRCGYESTGKLPLLDFSPLLAAIEASYTTAEEHALHQGGASEGNDELTFF